MQIFSFRKKRKPFYLTCKGLALHKRFDFPPDLTTRGKPRANESCFKNHQSILYELTFIFPFRSHLPFSQPSSGLARGKCNWEAFHKSQPQNLRLSTDTHHFPYPCTSPAPPDPKARPKSGRYVPWPPPRLPRLIPRTTRQKIFEILAAPTHLFPFFLSTSTIKGSITRTLNLQHIPPNSSRARSYPSNSPSIPRVQFHSSRHLASLGILPLHDESTSLTSPRQINCGPTPSPKFQTTDIYISHHVYRRGESR